MRFFCLSRSDLLTSTKLELAFLFCKNTHFERLESKI
nr:MAG TPA_asm: hypothetical protein [Caudoviricetes sp.]DAO49592.1 MAG TPA: hypothetical protein [Caudoviricetes sp.]